MASSNFWNKFIIRIQPDHNIQFDFDNILEILDQLLRILFQFFSS